MHTDYLLVFRQSYVMGVVLIIKRKQIGHAVDFFLRLALGGEFETIRPTCKKLFLYLAYLKARKISFVMTGWINFVAMLRNLTILKLSLDSVKENKLWVPAQLKSLKLQKTLVTSQVETLFRYAFEVCFLVI